MNKDNTVLLCGAGREDITPEIGTCLYGYRPDIYSKAVHDSLFVTAAAFSDGADTFLLVTCDVCEIDCDLSDRILKETSLCCGIPEDRITVSAIHTHSAPNVAGLEGWGGIDEDYSLNIFLPAIKKASQKALESMKKAAVGVSSVKSDVGMNRREITRQGRVILGQNPWGLYDPEMTVIAVKDEDGNGIINLVHYGCHGTAAGENFEISRDWPGVMVDRLEKESGVMTAYWQGCCGDVGPRIPNGYTVGLGDIKYAEELGAVAGRDAVKAYKQIKSFEPKTVKVFSGKVSLPLDPLPDISEIEETLKAVKDPEKLINIDRLKYDHLVNVRDAVKNGVSFGNEFNFNVSIPVLGDIVFMPFPFEMFSETGLKLRRFAPYEHVLALSNSNGTYLYLPTRGEILNGGYEVECFLYGHVFNFSSDAEICLVNEYLRIMGL
ncbi:MAG: neutral/alkaline non-lysosomal ceramidase N-terminal domain-containing protein [Clostridia bacterium]|nr:neutral/alkaline non-lysosomal ceramidase N-terminal domain-containing protein [Clostridia bacterium]